MSKFCKGFLDSNNVGYLVEYYGDIKSQINSSDYVCGTVISPTLAVVSLPFEKIDKLQEEIPAITFVEPTSIYTLQNITPSNIESIYKVKENPYLGLTGRGVLVGVIDTGIDYLNQEFMREDDTTRIKRIWDQSVIPVDGSSNLYIGKEYKEEDINKAIQVFKSGGNPYSIVPSRDTIGHGTQMSSIIGARGFNPDIEGVANDCEFCIVKLNQYPLVKKLLKENGLTDVPAYNNTEVITAIEYIRRVSVELKKPVVIYIGVGTMEGCHDGSNITSSYIDGISSRPGIIVVSGTGNSGSDEGHFMEFIKNVNESKTAELVMPKEQKVFNMYIWVQKPNRMKLNIISPTGENSGEFLTHIVLNETRKFYLSNTVVKVRGVDPESLTGNQLYSLTFKDIKPGIWKFILTGVFIIDGRVDIWLSDKSLLPSGTKFLKSNQFTTLTIPSTSEKTISVSYYDGETEAVLGESGKGFTTDGRVNPNIATIGTNVLTTSLDRKSVSTVSGSSVATAIMTGACALIIQWGIVNGNDPTLYSTKLKSLLIYAANREDNQVYPNEVWGYGKLNLYNVFNIIGGNFRTINDNIVRYDGNIFFRIPKDFLGIRYKKYKWRSILSGGDS